MSFNIVLHTLRMIFGNIGQALRVSIGPYLIAIILGFLALMLVGPPNNATFDPTTQSIPAGFGFLPLLLLPLIMFVTSWVAVSWHRFILLEEYSGILPAVSGRPIWSYAGKAILLGLLLLATAIPLFFALGAVAVPAMGVGGPTSGMPIYGIIIFVVASSLLTFLSLRWGVALVGTALGKPMGFGDAWRVTKPIGNVILGVAVILMLINIVPGIVLNPLTLAAPLIGTLLQLMLTWLTMMMGISILTTLYGHVIEERPLIS